MSVVIDYTSKFNETDLKMIKEYLLNKKNKVAQDFFLECSKLPEGSPVPHVDKEMVDVIDKLVSEIDYELEMRYPTY